MASNRVVHLRVVEEGSVATALRDGIVEIQAELEVTPEFSEAVEAVANESAANPRLPDLDRTDLEFVTIDPPTAQDLDQALFLERADEGYRVYYAIADVAAFVTPGDPVDQEAHLRGQSLYGADSKVPLHPKAISEDAGSLLADQVRPALVWCIELDGTGERTGVNVERALVRSRAKLDYAEVQRQLDDGAASESLRLLAEVGVLREAIEAERGGISLPLPEQEVDVEGDGVTLQFRPQVPVERFNAQISLLTGYAAASLMIQGKVGLLRTLPPPDPRDVTRLRRTAKSLGLAWPGDQDYPEFIRTLDPAVPAQAAMVVASTRLLRGSGYAAFDGEVPEQPLHAALASSYAHATAPLRRLADRYVGEICVALCAGTPVPDWVLARLDDLPQIMGTTSRTASSYERAVVNLVEALLLAPRIGETFTGVVVDVENDDPQRGDLSVSEPAVEAQIRADRDLPLGTEVRAILTTADPKARRVGFTLAE